MSFLLKIVTPKGKYFEGEVDSLTIKLTSGYRTFLSHHAPLIGALAYAPMHYVKDGQTHYFAIHGGAISVKDNSVSVIVNGIENKKDIDVNRAKEAKKRAEERLKNKNDINIDVKRAELALARAISRIKTYEGD